MNDPNSSIVGEYGRIFLNDCELFPNAQSNDTVDTMSQAFIYLRDLGEIFNTGDYIPEPQPQKFKG